jgi:hypothetical protein
MMKNLILASATLFGGLTAQAMDLDSITAESNRQIKHANYIGERLAQPFGNSFDDVELEQELASLMGEVYVPQAPRKMTEDEELEAQILAMHDNDYSNDPELAALEREIEAENQAQNLLSNSEIINDFVMVDHPVEVTPSTFWTIVSYITFGAVKL